MTYRSRNRMPPQTIKRKIIFSQAKNVWGNPLSYIVSAATAKVTAIESIRCCFTRFFSSSLVSILGMSIPDAPALMQ